MYSSAQYAPTSRPTGIWLNAVEKLTGIALVIFPHPNSRLQLTRTTRIGRKREEGVGQQICRDVFFLARFEVGRRKNPENFRFSPMAKNKRKLTAAEKRAKKKRRKETMVIFINGKQKRVKRPPSIDGIPVDEFIERNADPIWLHQNGMWEMIGEQEGFA
jgi:hypothetical protein